MSNRKMFFQGVMFFALTAVSVADSTRVPYLEAVEISQKEPQAAGIQRELVLLSAQSRLTSSWPKAYQMIGEVAIGIGRADLAKQSFNKYLTLEKFNAMIQMELITIDLESYQTVEARRQFLDSQLKRTDLLPEVLSDLYRQLAAISWSNYEPGRAEKYLDLSVKREPMNLQARQLLEEILLADAQAGQLGELKGQLGELESRIMINPLDSQTALQLAILAGKANLPQAMNAWLEQANKIQKVYSPKESWPIGVKVSLAESYLATNQPEKAVEILKTILGSSATTQTASQPAQAQTQTEMHARILISLAAEALNDETIMNAQTAWFNQFARNADERSAASSEEYILGSLWFSLYSPKSDYVQAVNLARKAGTSPMAKITLALALAKSGEMVTSSSLIKEIGASANPLVILTQEALSYNRKQLQEAGDILTQGLKVTPYGSLRQAMLKTAKVLGLENPPQPDLSNVISKFDRIGKDYLKPVKDFTSLVDLDMKVRGELTRGQIVDVSVTLTNRSTIPLFIGSGSLINPFVAIEIQPAPGNQRSFIHYIPINTRQHLEPGQAITVETMLNEVAGMDSFISNRSSFITQVTLKARILASVPGSETKMFALAESPKSTVTLPRIDQRNAEAMEDYLKSAVTRDSWETARLAYWLLLSKSLDYEKPMIVDAMLRELKSSTSPETRAAFAWALRGAKPDGKIFNALATLLQDGDWMVRLMALDTLGQLQGNSGKTMYKFYAVRDCDPLVRQLATSYLLVK